MQTEIYNLKAEILRLQRELEIATAGKTPAQETQEFIDEMLVKNNYIYMGLRDGVYRFKKEKGIQDLYPRYFRFTRGVCSYCGKTKFNRVGYEVKMHAHCMRKANSK